MRYVGSPKSHRGTCTTVGTRVLRYFFLDWLWLARNASGERLKNAGLLMVGASKLDKPGRTQVVVQ